MIGQLLLRRMRTSKKKSLVSPMGPSSSEKMLRRRDPLIYRRPCESQSPGGKGSELDTEFVFGVRFSPSNIFRLPGKLPL